MKSWATVAVLIISLLSLMGCSITDDNADYSITKQAPATRISLTQETSPMPLIEESTESVIRPVSTPTSIRQSTLIPYPTKTTLLSTPFPAFDIASSTLSEEVATQKLIELLETNRYCELPCWWGIIPGETDVDSIESTFVPLGFDWYRDYEELEDRTPYMALIYVTSFENGVVKSIEVHGGVEEETYGRNEAWRPYAIPRILERLGLPDDVYVYYPFQFDPGGMQAYRLFFTIMN